MCRKSGKMLGGVLKCLCKMWGGEDGVQMGYSSTRVDRRVKWSILCGFEGDWVYECTVALKLINDLAGITVCLWETLGLLDRLFLLVEELRL